MRGKTGLEAPEVALCYTTAGNGHGAAILNPQLGDGTFYLEGTALADCWSKQFRIQTINLLKPPQGPSDAPPDGWQRLRWGGMEAAAGRKWPTTTFYQQPVLYLRII